MLTVYIGNATMYAMCSSMIDLSRFTYLYRHPDGIPNPQPFECDWARIVGFHEMLVAVPENCDPSCA